MRLLLAVFVLVFAAALAQADSVWVWTDDGGALSFTDEQKRVPARYKEQAEQRPLAPLADYERLTPSASAKERAYASERLTTRLEKLRKRNSIPVFRSDESQRSFTDCGTVVLRSERRQDGEYNSRFFIAEDDCGVLYDSKTYPQFNVIR